jgi:hypothetical protein
MVVPCVTDRKKFLMPEANYSRRIAFDSGITQRYSTQAWAGNSIRKTDERRVRYSLSNADDFFLGVNLQLMGGGNKR